MVAASTWKPSWYLPMPSTDPDVIADEIALAVDECAQNSWDDEWLGTVYLIHFASPIAHASHYLGWTRLAVEARLERHRTGQGARLLRAANERGIEWWLTRVWYNQPQAFERQLKRRHEGPRLCPLCSSSAWNYAQEEEL